MYSSRESVFPKIVSDASLLGCTFLLCWHTSACFWVGLFRDFSGMDTNARTPKRQRRIARACDACRKRKARCDGGNPCSLCAQHEQDCVYREKARIRNKRQSTASNQVETRSLDTFQHQPQPRTFVPEANSAHQGQEHANVTSRSNYLSGVPASTRSSHDPTSEQLPNPGESGLRSSEFLQSISAARPQSRLHYGPTSNFAFLQHVHQTFDNIGRATDPSRALSALETFKQREIFFDLVENEKVRPDTSSAQALFLPQQLATQFLDNFIVTLHKLMSWVAPSDLRSMLYDLYSPSQNLSNPTNPNTILLLFLAIGATVTQHDQWAEDLYVTATNQSHSLREVVNLKSIQISLLAAHFQMIYGRPNSAYLKLGEGCRKAFAMGLHQDTQYADNIANESQEEKRTTLWSLVFLERWISFWLGRPSCCMAIPIQSPLPSRSPEVYCLASLSSIIEDIIRNIYGAPQLSVTQLWENAQQVKVKLQNIEKYSESMLGYPLDGRLSGPPLDIGQVFFMNCKHVTLSATFLM